MLHHNVLLSAFTYIFCMRTCPSVQSAVRAWRITECRSIPFLTHKLRSDVLLGGFLHANLFGAFNVLSKSGASVSICLKRILAFACGFLSPIMHFDGYSIGYKRFTDVLFHPKPQTSIFISFFQSCFKQCFKFLRLRYYHR